MGRYTRSTNPASSQVIAAALDEFENASPAESNPRQVLPPGQYVGEILPAETFLFTAKSGAPGFKVAYRVCEGQHTGRRLWQDFWLTNAAIPYTKAALARIGIERKSQLNEPLPAGIRVRLRVVVETTDSGEQFNSIRELIELVSFEPPSCDPFAPTTDSSPAASQPQQRPAVDPLTELPF